MRPVNLIPADERRGEGAPTRSGPLAYAVVGLLVVALAVVAGVTLLGNKISDRKAEVANLEQRSAEADARAESLSQFTTFQQVHDARVQTVQSLATSRFDWERVLHELSRVLPEHVWITGLVGTVSADAQGGGSGSGLASSIAGPSLEIDGCGRSQTDVARFVAAMHDIDGVTRVAASDSAKSGDASDATGASASSGSCSAPTAPAFHLVAAFDAVAVTGAAPSDPTTATTSTTTPTTTTTPATTAPTTSEPGAATSDATTSTESSDQVTDPGTPSADQERRIDTGKSIVGAGG